MPSGLAALLDDIAGITKLAAASLDDVGGAASKAGVKAAGVVVDDTAVTPGYAMGFTPDRELPIVWKIAVGSFRNKLLFLLPGALILSAFAPWAVTPILMVGGAYLAFEATEKIIEAFAHHEGQGRAPPGLSVHSTSRLIDADDIRRRVLELRPSFGEQGRWSRGSPGYAGSGWWPPPCRARRWRSSR